MRKNMTLTALYPQYFAVFTLYFSKMAFYASLVLLLVANLEISQRTIDQMESIRQSSANVPLIRLSLLNPFIDELTSRQVPFLALLEEAGLPADTPFLDETFVASNTVYAFLEMASEATGDRYLGARIGQKADLESLPQFSVASEHSSNVGDLLTRLVSNSQHHSTSVRMALRVEPKRSSFSFVRIQEPDRNPTQVDGYYVGMLYTVFSSALGEDWQANRMLARVSDPDAVPADFGELTLLKGDRSGVTITFPTEWLIESFNRDRYHAHRERSTDLTDPPTSLIGSVRDALAPHIHETDLTVDRGAEICGFDTRQLSRRLKAKGTTLSQEIAKLRQERSATEIAGTNRKISDIAYSVGFTDPTVFSRAFKNWTGQSPQEYRRNHKQRTLRR